MNDIAYAINDGSGQFVSSFSIHTSGKKGTTLSFSFCQDVAAQKRSAAILYPYEQALQALNALRFFTDTASVFGLTKCERVGESWRALP